MKNGDQSMFPQQPIPNGLSGEEYGYIMPQGGLTKREYFAALFTQAIVSSIDSERNYERLRDMARRDGMKVSQWIARDAVKQTDALLKELEKTKDK